ncbi:hypothetical protein TrCOL_g12980 [Triparma columacea]|uniref:Phosphoglycerate mutase n=1 Tax=Triparma columacea TaxID=722753 RepID=A0A9W7GCN8_9STRA|nr:hypothetical protein TrCOL_g12980 [Triparma columacea]
MPSKGRKLFPGEVQKKHLGPGHGEVERSKGGMWSSADTPAPAAAPAPKAKPKTKYKATSSFSSLSIGRGAASKKKKPASSPKPAAVPPPSPVPAAKPFDARPPAPPNAPPPAARTCTFYLLRHGETAANAKGIVQGQGLDGPLNPTGFRQAVGVGNSYREGPFGRKPDFIFCSDMLRTRETLAGVLLGYSGVTPSQPPPSRSPPPGSPLLPLVEYRGALRERAKGALEGRRNDLTLEEAEELRLKEGGGEVKLETEEQLCERLRGFVKGVLEGVLEGVKGQDTKVLVVTHGGCLRAFLKGVFKVVPDDTTVRVFNSSTTVVQVEVAEGAGGAGGARGGEGWKATLLGPVGDISFIPAELVTQRSDW